MLHAARNGTSYQERALAQLDSLIGWAEGDLVQCRHLLLSAGRTRSEEGEELDCAQSRLELLRRSRDFLLCEFPLRVGGPHR